MAIINGVEVECGGHGREGSGGGRWEMVGREEREKLFLVWQLKNNWSEFIEIVKIGWSEFKVLKIRVRQ